MPAARNDEPDGFDPADVTALGQFVQAVDSAIDTLIAELALRSEEPTVEFAASATARGMSFSLDRPEGTVRLTFG